MALCQVAWGSKSFFAKTCIQSIPSLDANTWKSYKFSKLEMQFLWMSHEINAIALNDTFGRWECLQYRMCPQSAPNWDLHWFCMLRIIQVILYLGISLDSSCNVAMRAWRFLSGSIMRRTFFFKNSLYISNCRHVWWGYWPVNTHIIVLMKAIYWYW